MQNREHELPKYISNSHEYTSGNNSSTANLQSCSVENDLSQMAISNDTEGQITPIGYPTDTLLPSQSGQIHNSNYDLKGFSYNFNRNAKINPDDMVEDIILSDDENPLISQDQYNVEMKKINELYNEEDPDSMNKYTGTKNEVDVRKEIPVAFVPDPESVLLEAGIIEDIIGSDKILVRANTERGILDLDNILFNSNKIPVGYLDDVIGKVDTPNYVVNFFPNINDSERPSLAAVDQSLFYVQNRTNLLSTNRLTNKKGCDASNAFDEEISDDDAEFSDDEAEAERKKKNKDKNKNKKQKTDTSHIKTSMNNLINKYSGQNNNIIQDNYGIGHSKVPHNNKQYQSEYSAPYHYNPNEGSLISNNSNQTGNPFYSNPYTFGTPNQTNMYGIGLNNNQFPYMYSHNMAGVPNINSMQGISNINTGFGQNSIPFNPMQQQGQIPAMNTFGTQLNNNNFNAFVQQINPFVRPDLNNKNNK